MSGVALKPMPRDLMFVAKSIKLLPKLGVLYGFLVCRPPAVFFTAVKPAPVALIYVCAVGIELDIAAFIKSFDRRDRGQQFHTIISR